MYTAEDLARINRRRMHYRIVMWAITAALAAGMVLSLIHRWEVAGYVLAFLVTFGWIFAIGMFGSPIRSYREFVRDMLEGRDRRFDGTVAHIETQDSQQKGMKFRVVHVREDGAAEGDPDRILYYDTEKLPMPFAEGDRMHFVSFGNYIKAATLPEEID